MLRAQESRAVITKLELLTFYFSDAFIYVFIYLVFAFVFRASKARWKSTQMSEDSEKVGNKLSATKKKQSMAQESLFTC